MIEERLFKYLREYYNFNLFYKVYLQSNPTLNFDYDTLFRDWTEESYEIEDYHKWHTWLLEITNRVGYSWLLEQIN